MPSSGARCGTWYGYQRHVQLREKACGSCRRAVRERLAALPETAKERRRAYNAATFQAVGHVARLDPDRYRIALADARAEWFAKHRAKRNASPNVRAARRGLEYRAVRRMTEQHPDLHDAFVRVRAERFKEQLTTRGLAA